MTQEKNEIIANLLRALRYNYEEYMREESASVGYHAAQALFYLKGYLAAKSALEALGYVFKPNEPTNPASSYDVQLDLAMQKERIENTVQEIKGQ